jgi:hypothetical protein
MSRALLSVRARHALDALASRHLSPTCKSLYFRVLGTIWAHFSLSLSLVSTTRRLHVHAEATPSTFHHVPDGRRRLTTPTSSPDISTLSQYLNQTFTPLNFPPELAQRILTHISHRDSLIGHNSRFSFLGAI